MILAKNTPSTTFSSQLDESVKSVTITQTSQLLSGSAIVGELHQQQHQNSLITSSSNPTLGEQEELIDFEDLEKLLTDAGSTNSTASDHWSNYFEDDEDLFEFDFSASPSSSDCSQNWDGYGTTSGHEIDNDNQFQSNNTKYPAVCNTSLSNYSVSTTTNSIHCSTPTFCTALDLDCIKQERQTPEMSGYIGHPNHHPNHSATHQHNGSNSNQCSACSTSEAASCTSSTPSTPYSFMTTATPLPSFNEIYSPHKISFTDESFALESSGDAKGDFFNFEEYFSESNSGSPSQHSPGSWQAGSDVYQIKQEPMEIFGDSPPSTVAGNVLDVKPGSSSAGTQVQFYELSSLNDPKNVTITGTFETPTGAPSAMGFPITADSCSEMSSNLSGSPTSTTTVMPHLIPAGGFGVSSDISDGLLSSCLPDRLKRSVRARASHSQICAVCGDIAACQHYGVLTCEGCKGFFKRTVQKCSKYNCMGNRDCVIDKRRRNRCQFCRFQKCLAVGMVKEVVRTDSLKGRRGRLPSKAKLLANGLGGIHSAVPMSTITALVRAHVDTSCDKANLDFSFYNEEIAQHAQKDPSIQQLLDNQLIRMLNSSLENLNQFVNRIPDFYQLDNTDQNLLFEAASLELLALRMAYRLKVNSDIVILANNMVLHRSQFVQTFGEEWFRLIERLSEQLSAIQIDLSAFSCLAALTVITDRPGLENPVLIEQLENKVVTALRDHTCYNAEAQTKHHYLSKILSVLPELRSIGEHCLSVLHNKQLPTQHYSQPQANSHQHSHVQQSVPFQHQSPLHSQHHQQSQQPVQHLPNHQNVQFQQPQEQWSLPCNIP